MLKMRIIFWKKFKKDNRIIKKRINNKNLFLKI